MGWLYVKDNIANLVPLIIFRIIWKERNSRAFEGVESSVYKIRDKWIHYFESILLGYDIISDENLRMS